MLSFHTALIMIRRARVSATRKLFFSPDNTAANRGSCPVLSLSSRPQHELGKVFTTEHGRSTLAGPPVSTHIPSGVRPRLPA